MDFIILTFAILLIILGVGLIVYYQKLKKENKVGGLSFKLQSVGIGALIIGIGLIIRELFELK